MECFYWINVVISVLTLGLFCWTAAAQNDYSGPIKCFYCFGEAVNSSCADPVNPRTEKGKSLEVIECEHGVCLKWTHFWQNKLYMRRTCSARMTHFKIMMIDGVCRSERTGNGYLCMCGKHLCNSSTRLQPYSCIYIAVFTVIACFKQLTSLFFSWQKIQDYVEFL